MVTRRIAIGKWGEEVAHSFLTARGVEIIGRNVRTAYGELDLIGRLRKTLIIFEVKTRTNDAYGYPEDSITELKKEHLINSAQAYLLKHPDFEKDWRIDVIAIRGKPDGKNPQVEWFENAVY